MIAGAAIFVGRRNGMTARAIRLSVLVLILTASGCNKAPALPPINASEYTLTWTETRDGSDPGFSARSTPPDLGMRELRQITINADNTFTMTLVDARSKNPPARRRRSREPGPSASMVWI